MKYARGFYGGHAVKVVDGVTSLFSYNLDSVEDIVFGGSNMPLFTNNQDDIIAFFNQDPEQTITTPQELWTYLTRHYFRFLMGLKGTDPLKTESYDMGQGSSNGGMVDTEAFIIFTSYELLQTAPSAPANIRLVVKFNRTGNVINGVENLYLDVRNTTDGTPLNTLDQYELIDFQITEKISKLGF